MSEVPINIILLPCRRSRLDLNVKLVACLISCQQDCHLFIQLLRVNSVLYDCAVGVFHSAACGRPRRPATSSTAKHSSVVLVCMASKGTFSFSFFQGCLCLI